MTELDRFWAKVDKNGPTPAHCPELGPCWVWTARTEGGYGKFWDGSKTCYAHRRLWEIYFGLILDGACVCHRCDNRPCIRPSHLFLGTYTENEKDKHNKGREARGERHGLAKLDAFTVRLLRRLHKRGLSQALLGRVFGVDKATVRMVCLRRTWVHVP